MTESEIRLRVQAELSPKRFRHTQGVVETAERLAARYGVDVTKARLAAWIHDVAREWPLDRLQQYAEKIEIPSGFGLIPVLLHGPIAAHLASEWFELDDEETANAIRYHTTGREAMSPLEMVIFLADAIEPGRSYPGVEELRALADEDLTLAVAHAIDHVLRYLLDKHHPIFPLTVMARNELWGRLRPQQ